MESDNEGFKRNPVLNFMLFHFIYVSNKKQTRVNIGGVTFTIIMVGGGRGLERMSMGRLNSVSGILAG